MAMEAVHDFWRRHVADESARRRSPPPCCTRKTPPTIRELVARSLASRWRRAWPARLDAPAAAIDTAALSAPYARAQSLWAARREEIVECLKAAVPALNKGSYKAATIDRAAAAWDAWFREAAPLAPIDTDAKPELFATARLKRGDQPGTGHPQHAFFDAADSLLVARGAINGDLDLAARASCAT